MKILIKILLIIPLLGIHDILCAQNTKPAVIREDLPDGTPPYKEVDVKRPEFVIGDVSNDSIKNYLQSKLVYPEEACLNDITGSIYVQYRVDTTGAVKVCGLEYFKNINSQLVIFENAITDMFIGIPSYAKPGFVDGLVANITIVIRVDFLSNDTCRVYFLNINHYKSC